MTASGNHWQIADLLLSMVWCIRIAQALSFADNCILTLAVEKHADMILSDDRLLRKTASIEGFRVIGTVGVLICGAKSSAISQKKSCSASG
jgi:predicted nucleic acid-binding protein